MRHRYISTTWEAWTYDVWGNAREGYEVNDRSCIGRDYPLRLRVNTYNAGTPTEFDGAYPTDAQIRALFGVSCRLETDGDDVSIHVSRARDGYPIGELHCRSHEALSPIRAVQTADETKGTLPRNWTETRQHHPTCPFRYHPDDPCRCGAQNPHQLVQVSRPPSNETKGA